MSAISEHKKIVDEISNELTYEEAFAELEAVVAALEADSNTLEQALALFARGQKLSHYCSGLLDQAELKILELSGEKLVDYIPEG
jgi:exodeoxyribonuclease VII small subunit